jgi:uroporphyrinogen-III synthase
MASLIQRHGGEPTVVPTMREVPLESNTEAFAFGERLMQGKIDAVIFMTGVGAGALREVLETRIDAEQLRSAIDCCKVAVRGPKPTAVLSKWGIHVDVRAPEPNTWHELLAAIDQAGWQLSGMTVALQEYGAPSVDLKLALRERGADVIAVNVYRWDLPEDVAPLRLAIHQMIAGEFDVLLVTSAQQVRHALQLAEEMGVHLDWLRAARQIVIGSIGPTASETLREFDLPPDVEPSHPKMGHLVMETLAAATDILARKRQRVAK